MRRVLILALVLLLVPLAYAHESEESICISYFYGDGCPNCAKVKPYLDAVEEEYGEQIHITRYEIYHNLKNYQLYNKYCDLQEIELENRGVPLVAIGTDFYVGSTSIKENLVSKIDEMIESGDRTCSLGDDMVCHNGDINQSSDTDSIIPGLQNKITLPLVLGAGLVDGINPCAFAVLLFLLMFLLEVSNSKKRMIKAGSAYVIAVYITYFLAGIGIFSIIQISGMSLWIVKVAAILAILFGLINIKDYFWYGKGFSLKIPESKKHIIEAWAHKANIPAAFVLGFLVSMFELPCTGGVYLAILAMLANTVTRAGAIGYLLLYNIMFILPLIAIIGLVTFGMKTEHIERWRTSKKNVMKLMLGLLMLLLGIGMLLGWF